MAWTAPRTWTTGELVTASIGNTHWRDNLLQTAPAIVTTQGDTLYATAANTLARLAKAAAGLALLRMNSGNTAPEWGTAGQIVFPAAQAASADANTLDDYEEGTWTAAFACGTSGTITINDAAKTGAYTKVGRQVTVTGYFTATSVSSPVGSLTLTGLPFTPAAGNSIYSAVAVMAEGLEATAATTIIGTIQPSIASVLFKRFAAGASAAVAGDVKAGSSFIICVSYFV